MQTLAIVGASGKTGKLVLQLALEAGYSVRALARDPSKLPTHPKLSVVVGEVGKLDALRELVRDSEAVLSCFGTVKKPNYVVENGLRNLLLALAEQQQPPKLLHLSAIGLGDSRAACRRSWLWTLIISWLFPLVGRELFADMERGEQLMQASSKLNYVIVRAGALSDKPARGYRPQRADAPLGKITISRADVARFMLEAASVSEYDREAISLLSK